MPRLLYLGILLTGSGAANAGFVGYFQQEKSWSGNVSFQALVSNAPDELQRFHSAAVSNADAVGVFQCKGTGWVALAIKLRPAGQGEYPYDIGGNEGGGAACGASAREAAEQVALERCVKETKGPCCTVFSGFDDNKSVATNWSYGLKDSKKYHVQCASTGRNK